MQPHLYGSDFTMGSELLELYHKKVKREWKIAFLSAVIFGLMVHLYKFTNTLPNHDSLFNYYSVQNGIQSGRWLLRYACGISSYFDLPWVIGFLSLTYIGITAAIIVDTLEFKNPVLIALTGGLLAAFPGVTETFFFQFTADGYFLAMAIAAMAVRLTKFECLSLFNTLLAAACICVSCGIYQTYVSFALVLALCYFILKLMEDETLTLPQIFQWIGAQAAVYILGLLTYYVAWKLLMHRGGYVANDYQGISNLAFSFDTVLKAFPNSIEVLKKLFFEWSEWDHGSSRYKTLNLCFLVGTGLIFLYSLFRSGVYKQKLKLVLVVLCAAVIPFGACLWLFASGSVEYRPMMLVSVCLVYILTGGLFEKYGPRLTKNLWALLLALILFNNCLMANIAYYYMNRTYQNTYYTAIQMMSEIKDLDTDTKKIAVIGSRGSEILLGNDRHARKIQMFSELLETDLLYTKYHLVYFINETFYENFQLVGEEWREDPAILSAAGEMPSWPEEGSIRAVGDTIVIKLKDVPLN